MKTNYINTAKGLIIFTVMFFAVNAFAMKNMMPQGMNENPAMSEMMPQDAYKNMMWYAMLPEEKQMEVQKIYDKYSEDITQVQLDLHTQQLYLKSLMFNDNTSQKEIEKQIDRVNRFRDKLFSKQVNMSLELKKQGVPYPHYEKMQMMGHDMMGEKKQGMMMEKCMMKSKMMKKNK